MTRTTTSLSKTKESLVLVSKESESDLFPPATSHPTRSAPRLPARSSHGPTATPRLQLCHHYQNPHQPAFQSAINTSPSFSLPFLVQTTLAGSIIPTQTLLFLPLL